MWRRTDESKPPLSPEPPAPSAPIPFERPAPISPVEPRPVKTTLGRGLAVKGELSGKEDVTIDGEFEGHIRVSGAGVNIGASGRVHAEIEADEIIVEGRFEGSLRARQRLSIRRSANATGSIETPRLVIEDGAVFRGRVEMVGPGETLTASRNVSSQARAERAAFPRVSMNAPETVS